MVAATLRLWRQTWIWPVRLGGFAPACLQILVSNPLNLSTFERAIYCWSSGEERSLLARQIVISGIMFEGFSFSTPSAARPVCPADGDDQVMVDCASTMISPLSSRCPSPSSMPVRSRPLSQSHSPYLRRPLPPTSMPGSHEKYHRRISVGMLTEKLRVHTLESDSSDAVHQHHDDHIQPPLSPISPTLSPTPSGAGSAYSSFSLLTPPEDHEDEGYDEPVYHDPFRPHSRPSFLYPTSVPSVRRSVSTPEDLSLGYRDEQHRTIRLHRQRLSRAQCSAPTGVDSIRLALLEEEAARQTLDSGTGGDCHPSSLPPELSPPRRRASLVHRTPRYRPVSGSGLCSGSRERSPTDSTTRRKSSSAASFSSASKVGKARSHHQGSSTRGLFLRKMRSEQTLGRKSLVDAALTLIDDV